MSKATLRMQIYLARAERQRRRNDILTAALWDLLMLFVLLAVILAACGGAKAATVLDASVIVRGASPQGASWTGGGTAIGTRDGHTLIVACGHFFRDAPTTGVTVTFYGGRTVAARVLTWSLNPDISLMSAAGEAPGIAPLSSTDAAIGINTAAVGMFGVRAGLVRSVNRYSGFDNLCVAGVANQGDSGGGVFNLNGELIGIISAADPMDGETIAVSLPAIRKAVASVLVHETAQRSCSWRQDACGNWYQSCPQQQYQSGQYQQQVWLPSQQPQQPTQPVQPPQIAPQPPKQDSQLVEIKQNITNINQSITTLQNQIKQVSGCDCSKACGDVEARLNAKIEKLSESQLKIIADIKAIREAKPDTSKYDELAKQLDHETPIRVYLPDGKLAGESKTNLFRGESIDFTFNPRALLDSTAGER